MTETIFSYSTKLIFHFQISVINGHTRNAVETASTFQIANFLENNFSSELTSHSSMPPKLFPTGKKTSSLAMSFRIQKLSLIYQFANYKFLLNEKPIRRVCWTGWKSIVVGEEPMFKTRPTALGKSSERLDDAACFWQGTAVGNTFCVNISNMEFKCSDSQLNHQMRKVHNHLLKMGRI